MRFDPGSLPFGVAPAIIKDCAKQLKDRDEPFTFDDFCMALGASRREARPVVEELVRQRFLETTDDGLEYSPTALFRQLALASVGAGLPRRDADALVRRIIEKAAQINGDPVKYPHRVTCVGVFGSYLTEKPLLGDLDIAVEVAPVPGAFRPSGERITMRDIERAAGSARTTIAALRLRKPRLISIHTFEEVRLLGTPYRVVFGEAPT
jgi:hypothetical protein